MEREEGGKRPPDINDVKEKSRGPIETGSGYGERESWEIVRVDQRQKREPALGHNVIE